MPEPADTLLTLAEASVTLAGFSGVVLVFGRRAAGEWSAADRTRLSALLWGSFGTLFTALLALLLLHAGVPTPATWRIASLQWAAMCAVGVTSMIRRMIRMPADDPERVTWVALLLVPLMLAVLALQLANAFALGAFWPLLLSLVTLLGVACVSFARLLITSRG